MHTLINILGYHLGSFTSHRVGDIDKQQCRFTDWSDIQRQHHNEISTRLGFWSVTTLMKPWSPALSFLLISCVSVEGFWADSRIENHFLLCSRWIQALKPHDYYNKTYRAIPFRGHNESFDRLNKLFCVLWLTYECIAVEFQVKIPCSKQNHRGKREMTKKNKLP